MDLRNRDRDRSGNGAHDVREDILLETNFDEDGALTMAHTTQSPYPYQNSSGNSPYKSAPTKSHIANNQNPLLQRNARRSFYRSDTSIDRYSEYSLHGRREQGSFRYK